MKLSFRVDRMFKNEGPLSPIIITENGDEVEDVVSVKIESFVHDPSTLVTVTFRMPNIDRNAIR